MQCSLCHNVLSLCSTSARESLHDALCVPMRSPHAPLVARLLPHLKKAVHHLDHNIERPSMPNVHIQSQCYF